MKLDWRTWLAAWMLNRLRVDLHEGCRRAAAKAAEETERMRQVLQAEVDRLRPRPGSGQRTFWAVFEPARGCEEPTPVVLAGSERDLLVLAKAAMVLRGFTGAELERRTAELLYGRVTANLNFYQARREQSLGDLERAQRRLPGGC